jgi:hypothetical protein
LIAVQHRDDQEHFAIVRTRVVHRYDVDRSDLAAILTGAQIGVAPCASSI